MNHRNLFLGIVMWATVACGAEPQWFIPVATACRTDLSVLRLTAIGTFGEVRRARPGISAHLHTGIDIRRPSANYDNEPVFPACKGVVISMRDDGPFAQIIIEHPLQDGPVWTVYEHVAGITCRPGDTVAPDTPIARFFSRLELDAHGWQFDHVHFEIMKRAPKKHRMSSALPLRRFSTYALVCYSVEELLSCYADPVEFLRAAIGSAALDKMR